MPCHPLKDLSVRTLVRRLKTQEYLQHSIEGKSFLRCAALAANRARQSKQRFYAGSVDVFLVGMVEQKVPTAGHIERLAKKVRA